ncbi:MAG: DMT family transporter, partial [Comamonas sp.]
MHPNTSLRHWRDVLLTALAPAIWGSTYIVASEILPPDRPFTAALIRALPAGLLLLLFTRVLPARRDWARLLVLSALNIGVFQALLFVAAYRLPGGLAAVLGAVQPLLVMLLAWGVDRRAPAQLTLWAALAGVAGLAVLLLSPQTHQLLSAFLQNAPAGSPWIEVRGDWIEDSSLYAQAQAAQ